MSIYLRKDGRYVVKFKDGNAWKQKTFRAREDAEGFERRLKYDEIENTRLTVAESILLFLGRTKHCPDVERYYAMILRRMGDVLASRYVDTLDRRDLETFRTAMRQDWHASNTSINMYVGKMLTAWRWCASEDFLADVPWEKYRPLPEPRHGHRCGDFSAFRKVYAICNAATQWAVRTCLALCLRPGGELTELRWKDVDLGRGCAHVWMSKVSRQKDVIPPAWWLDEAREKRKADTPEDWVCRNTRDRHWTQPALQSAWERACQKAGFDIFPLYTVRHLAASLMMEAGADVAAVAAQLGHSSVTTTGAFYTHLVLGAQERAARALPDFGAEWCRK